MRAQRWRGEEGLQGRRFVSQWPSRRAALFCMQICRCGVLSPLMECWSSTANVNPRNAAVCGWVCVCETSSIAHPLYPSCFLVNNQKPALGYSFLGCFTLKQLCSTLFIHAVWFGAVQKLTVWNSSLLIFSYDCISLSFLRVNLASARIH